MRLAKVLAALFGVTGICAGVFCVTLAFRNMNSGPVLVKQPEHAREQIVTMMNAVCSGDYDAAGDVIQGNPSFGMDCGPEDAAGRLIWDAFVESIRYEFLGEMYATDSGVAQDITVTALDMDSVTANLKERAGKLLEQRVAKAETPEEVYDENYEYREEFVMQVLYDAALQALEEDAESVTSQVTVHMIYENGRWWIVSDSKLMNVISGGILK